MRQVMMMLTKWLEQGMVRLSVGMPGQVPTAGLTSVQDPFKDTNRLILPPLILIITNADEDESTYPG